MPVMTERGTVLSLPDAIGQILEEHVKNAPPTAKEAPENLVAVSSHRDEREQTSAVKQRAVADYGFMPECPECGAQLQMGEGCLSCRACGFSRCM
jgi:ribonucleoside-diphosphate reductase alpha chain